MGNFNNSRDKLGCGDISRQEYEELRTNRWQFQEGYLFQTDVKSVGDSRLQVIEYYFTVQSQQYFQKLNMMSKYLTKGNLHFPLLCISESNQECTCGQQSPSLIKFYYQPHDIVLGDEIKARVNCRQTFSEEEIWFILYNIVNALRQFEPFCEASGNLTIQQIVLNNEGKIRLRNELSSPFELPRSNLSANYFAPEELYIMKKAFQSEGLISRDLYKYYHVNPNISQVFSLGIVLLVLTTGFHPTSFYSPPFQTNKKAIETQVDRLQKLGYSRLLQNLAKIMLTSYKSRPLPSQIYSIFKQFESEIMNFRPFCFSLAQSQVQSIY